MGRIKTAARLLRSQQGMTLIEIMVVVAILGMISTLVAVGYVRYLESSRVNGTKIQMQNLVQALDAYKVQYGSYPSTEEGFAVLQAKKVITRVPKDSWQNEFEYIRNSSSSFTIKSYGADGGAGGTENDADIILEQ